VVFAVVIFAFVYISVGEHLYSSAVLPAPLEKALIDTNVADQLALAMEAVILPLAFVLLAGSVQVYAEATFLVSGEHALVAGNTGLYEQSLSLHFNHLFPLFRRLPQVQLPIIQPN